MLSRSAIVAEAKAALEAFGDLYTTYKATRGDYAYNPGTGQNELVKWYEYEFKAVYAKPDLWKVVQSGGTVQVLDMFIVTLYDDAKAAFEGQGFKANDKIYFPSYIGGYKSVVTQTFDSAAAIMTIQLR